MGTQYCGDISFLLDFHSDVDQLHIETEVTSLYDISFQQHNDVAAIKQRNIKLIVIYVIVILIFNLALIWDKDENSISNGKRVLFQLSKCSDRLYGNIALKDANWNEHLNYNFLGLP